MPSFSKRSRSKLDTCHNDIIAVCNELILVTDFTVLHGHRTPEEQMKLFQKGREFKGGRWIIENQNEIVTYKDGYEKKSRHNLDPSTAVDITPYPINWKDYMRIQFLAGAFLTMAYRLKVEGIIESEFTWGGHWKSFKDWPHFQIKRS